MNTRDRLVYAAGERWGAIKALRAVGLASCVESAGARTELEVIALLVAIAGRTDRTN